MLKLIPITEADFSIFVENNLLRVEEQFKDKTRKLFPLRLKSVVNTPYFDLIGGLAAYPRTERVVHAYKEFGHLLTEPGYECSLVAFKSAAPFRVKVAGKVIVKANAGCYRVDKNDDMNGDRLVARCDTLECIGLADTQSVEVEIAAVGIVAHAEILPATN